ncbi:MULTISPECIES: hypothetical protein [unclassified Frondihabitans]|uniref:hypothetical protein n=1 Tax=unclassified Frondihabitans TaxID=2626248 RepID=UPI0012FBEDA0|nr:hypothetical protein [Frondihabitans sp. Leaf304]
MTYRATMLYEGDIGGVHHAEGTAGTRAGALAVAEREVPAGTRVVGVVVADDDSRFETRLD